MPKPPSLHTLVLLSAFLLGVAGDVLLRDMPLGLNWTIWCLLFAAVAALLARVAEEGQMSAPGMGQAAGPDVGQAAGSGGEQLPSSRAAQLSAPHGSRLSASGVGQVSASAGSRVADLVPGDQHSTNTGLARGWPMMLGVAVVSAACVAWRDSPALVVFSVLGATTAGFLGTLPKNAGPLRKLHVTGILLNAFVSLVDSIIGAGLLLGEGRRKEAEHKRQSWRVAEIVRGTILAVPLLLIFGALFVAADATFEHLVVRVLNIDLPELLKHGFMILLIAWPLAGIFRDRFLSGGRRISGSPKPPGLSLGLPEVSIAAGSLVLLTALFLGTQLVYLFGGSDYVLGAPSLTLAEYARRGFFELVTAAVLILPVLLFADWLLRKDEPRIVARFRLLALAQIVLLFVLMASAMHRLVLYQEEFGLTQLRLHATAVLVWLSGVLVWFGATVLRGRRELFAVGAFLGGVLILVGLHALNPDDLIVRVNVARASEGKELDTAYLTSLSADAVPRLVASLPAFSSNEQEKVGEKLFRMRRMYAGQPWHTWNYSRARALSILRDLDLRAPVEKAAGSSSGAATPPRDRANAADSVTSPQTRAPHRSPSR